MYAADLMVRAQKARDCGMSISDCLAGILCLAGKAEGRGR